MVKITSEILFSVALCLVLLLVPGGFSFAGDHDVTDQVNVYSGLAPALQLTCDDISFGSWTVPRGLRANGATKIELVVPANTHLPSRVAQAVLTSLGVTPGNSPLANIIEPELSQCQLTGSSLTEGTEVTLVLKDNLLISLSVAPVLELTAGKTVAIDMKANLSTHETIALIDDNGSALWIITGDLNIPDGLDPDNYGGFSSSGSGATAVYTLTN